MTAESVDLNRRHFLTVATSVTGAIGVGLAAVPFVSSMRPSARAEALGAAVEVDVSKIEPGAMIRVIWRGKAVFIVNRTDEMLAQLPVVRDRLDDPDSIEPQQPDYAQNEYRSIRDEILILVGVCTHLGCAPSFHPEVGDPEISRDPDWRGGMFCPCHGSMFDMAGRVYKGVPAPLNLPVPPHRYLTDSIVVIGDDTGAA